MPEAPLGVLVFRFQVGQDRVATRAPVNDAFASIDKSFFVEIVECRRDRPGGSFIEREPFPRPINGGPQPSMLGLNRPARLSNPFPYTLEELFPPHGAAVNPFCCQRLLDDELSCDTGVVRAGKPERRLALHAMPP